MSPSPSALRASSFSWFAALAVVTLAVAWPAEAQNAPAVRNGTSLKFVPADAAFYSTGLRLRQQFDAVANSRALARLMELPALKMARQQLEAMHRQPPTPELKEIMDWLSLPENKPLIDVLIDAVSHEVFVYGDAGYADTLQLVNRLNIEMRTAQLEAAKAGGNQNEILARRMSEVLLAQADRLQIPDTVIGFKVADPKRAEEQLARVEKMLAAQIEMQQPMLKGRLTREKLGAAEFVTLKLDGTLIPWGEIPVEAAHKAQFDKLAEKLKTKTLTISLGVRDGYLLLSTGDTSDHLKTLGQGQLLIDRPEFAPLAKHADKPLTSIAYASQRLMEQANTIDSQIDQWVAMAEQLLPLSELDAALQKEIIADAKLLGQDLKKYIPRPGSIMGFAFLTPRGLEGYQYNRGQHPALDGTQKLTLIDQVGGDPLAFVTARGKASPEDYEIVVKWIKRMAHYGERIGLSHLQAEQRALYDKLRADLLPLAARFDKATRDLWIPAFQNGESALVIDADLTSQQWQKQMPPAKQPLPMLEIGVVYSHNDAAKVKQAGSEFFAIVDEAVKKVRAAAPGQIPEFPLTPPQAREFPEGTVYYYSLPQAAGLDSQLAPNAGLSRDRLVLTLLPKFSLRLLKKTPLSAAAGPLANRDRPLAVASYLNWAGLIDAVAPWVDYGIDQAHGADASAAKPIKDQVRVGLDFLKCLRTISSVAYFEDGALVTHTESHFADQK